MSHARSGGNNIKADRAVLYGNTAGRDHVTISITLNGYVHGGIGPEVINVKPGRKVRIANRNGYKRNELRGLQVVGDSMVGKNGVRNGDIVIARVTKGGEIPKNGSMVVAWYPGIGGPVVKFLFYNKKANEISLKSANPDYDVIHLPAEHVEIQGVVVEVIPSFQPR
jgi:phage repressor protein C with HTH and peptisase S24 domain